MATPAFQSIVPSIVPFRVPIPVRDLLSRILGITELERVYDVLHSMGGHRSIADRLLESLRISQETSDADLARIPAVGPTLITANHPFGILEGAVLASLLGRVRKDIRFLANGILTALPEAAEMTIAVDPISGSKAVAGNGQGWRRALGHLQDGGLLVVFPAGEVSSFHWRDRAVADRDWNPDIARMLAIAARKGCRVSVVPAYVKGANSSFFQIAGLAHPGIRTALLGRELLNKRGCHIEVRFGVPITTDKLRAMQSEKEQIDYLRWRTYLLASRQRFKPRTASPLTRQKERAAQLQPVAEPLPAQEIAAEVAALPSGCLLNRSGELAVYLTRAPQIPKVLHEIGRLREITFREAGEGTGKALDLDEFDPRYLHLFVWNRTKLEVAGAYRLAQTDVARQRFGIHGLYTATLFAFGDDFLQRLGPALELGRSFIRKEYQKGFAPLLLLWKGIGTYVAMNPQYKTLFGPVSISNQYQAVSRELMMSYLEKYALLREWSGLVRNRFALPARLLKGAHRPAFPQSGFEIEDLATVLSDVEPSEAGVPVLLRQYLRLGGKLLGFNVDPGFANALDGLILVNLTKTEPKLLERYLGKEEAATFLKFQKENHGTI
jgi:putative hemolysin